MSKSFDECKGYVIAAFQDSLEKAWIDQLANKFPVQINSSVLNALVKK
jgi:peptidyl-prolyl cis-trans isomerase SurA